MATTGASRADRVKLRATFPHVRELAIIAGAYMAYMYTRSLAFDDFGATALSNAAKIISLEKIGGLLLGGRNGSSGPSPAPKLS